MNNWNNFITRIGALLVVAAMGMAGAAHAQSYTAFPSRTVGPFVSGQASPAPGGGWTAADDRAIGQSIDGQSGWIASATQPTRLDNEISAGTGRFGSQSWRVSNWYHDGVVNHFLSPAFGVTGETGSVNGNGDSPLGNHVVYAFWFFAPTTANDGAQIGISLTDAAGKRMSYVDLRDDGTNLSLRAIGISNSAGTFGAPPFNDAPYVLNTSPALVRGVWYRVVIDATFVDGQDNDQVSVDLYDAHGVTVWSVANVYSWEPAYWDGLFSAPNTLVAVNHVGFRVVENPDFNDRRDGNSYSVTNRPWGFQFDDMSMTPDAGTAFSTGFDSERWVAAAGGSDTGDCSVQTSPCASIEYAIAQSTAYDTIHIAAGTYANESLTVNLDGLRLIGEDPNNKPIIAKQSGGTDQPLLVIDAARDVRVENLEFAMDQSFVGEGILASGFVDGLAISGNHFVSSRSSVSVNSSYSYRNAIAINYVNNSQGLPRVNGSTVAVDDNTIDGIGDIANGVFLRAGVQMDASNGSVANNVITAGVHDIVVRFATATAASSDDTVSVDDNQTFGRGLEIGSPNASITQIAVGNNAIHAPGGINDATVYPADWSLVRLIGNAAGVPTILSGNTFSGHQGHFRGVLVENYPGIQLDANTFAPAAGAGDFVSLVISNKEITTDGPAQPPLAISLTAHGNGFLGSGVVGAGTAVELLNDNDAGATASFGALLFGGPGAGEANSFAGDLRWYFHLDDYNCETVNAPTCDFLDYAGAIGTNPGTNTEVRPFAGNVTAADNIFDGVAPAAMTAAEQTALFARTYDSHANASVGSVDYALAPTTMAVHVDDDYASGSHSYGDPLAFTTAATGSLTAYWQIDAFATIPEGVMHVGAGGTVFVAKGIFPDSVVLNKALALVGDGNDGSGTLISGPVTITTGGTSSSEPLVLSTLRISNPSGDGVTIANANHLEFDQVSLSGNAGEGMDFTGISDKVLIQDSIINANVGMGLRTATMAQLSNVTIDSSTFSNNLAGLVLFGGSGSGNGQITNWIIQDSQFIANFNADTTAWGGGIWIKTGGPGSSIDGFIVTGSQFADNGSSNPLNQVGITVRARPGSTMRNVSICSNSFVETGVPGTQLTGINVFDDTANNGYSPIEVCADNTFTGLDHSVSGLEQYALRGTQPVVNITGGTIANTNHINVPVIRVRDSATFPTIGLAMTDVGTLAGDEIHAPAGLYHENVVVSHDNMILSGDGAGTVIDGAGLPGSGVTLPNGRTGVTLTNFTVQNFTNIGGGGGCIFGAVGNDNTTVSGTTVANCKAGRGGIFFNGPVDSLAIDGNDVSDADGRGIVVWNGFKTDITITDNHVHDLSGCCGIELQDGTASGVTVTGNLVENTGDAGMAFIGLTSGAGPNLIDNNTINNTGRFGIEIKLPNGTGLESGDGSIVASNNLVTRPAKPTSTDPRDIGGIVVIRRGFCPTCGETDITTGVVVKDNTVSGWVPLGASPNDGFGIVVEGTNMHVYGNTVSGNDIGIQLQAGNGGFPGDSDQAATNDYFSRGNAQASCVDLGSNNLSGNNIDSRSISNPPGQMLMGGVHNQTQGTYFCSIQNAIDDSATVAGDVITVEAGIYAENVVVDKGITLQGPFAGVPGFDASRDGTGESVISPASGRAVRIINTSNVVFDGFTIQNVNDTAISSGSNYGGISDNVQIINNRVIDVHAGSGLYTNGPSTTPVTNWTVSNNLFRNIESSGGSGINLWAVTSGAISDNHVEDSAFGGIQIIGGVDVRIVDNSVSNTAHNGINVGASQDVVVSGNDIVDANTSGTVGEAGLTLYGGTSNVTMLCNSVSGSGTNGFSTSPGIADPFSNIRVFDNAMTVTSSVSHNLAQAIVIGSNWYGGGSASVVGSNAGGVQLADALAATPIGTSVCTNPDPATANDPAQLVLYSGDGQSTPISTAFGQPLEARVEDALGGAVMGESIAFTAPVSGASAILGTASGTSNFNGVVSTTAAANALAGGYFVTASSGPLETVGFSLTNTQGTGTVVFDNLSLIYNGSAQTLLAHIAEDSSGVCTLIPATVTNAGSYPVTASCSGDNYTATGSATAVVAPAPVTVTLSDLTQVFDGTPKPATVTTSPAGVAVGVTYNGSGTAPSAIGDYAVVATVTDPNYDATSTSGVLHIVAGDAPDIAVTITDDRDYAQYGELLTYTITVDNLGNTEVNGTISNVLPATLLAAEPSWSCVPVGTATCTGNGSGPLNDSFSVPPGGGVVYLLNAWVNDDQSLITDLIENTVTVSATGDVDTSNDSATDTTQTVIFRDGFENGGDGAEWLLDAGTPVALGDISGSSTTILDLVTSRADGHIFTVASVRGSQGDLIEVQAVRIDSRIQVRLSGHSDGAARVTGWTVAQAGLDRLALGVASTDDHHTLLLVGGAQDLELPLSSAATLSVSATVTD